MRTRPHVRLMQWNLWNQQGADLEGRVAHLAEVIALHDPDVVTFQEATQLADGTGVEERLAELTGLRAVVAPQSPGYPGRFRQGLLTRLEVTHEHHELLPPGSWGHDGWRTYLATAHLRSASGRSWHVGSVHKAWGGPVEAARVAQAAFVDEHFASHTRPGEVAVLGGDFNTDPESDTLRFYTGRGVVDGRSTYWLDAWAVAGDDAKGHTNGPSNDNCLTTAAGFLLDPSMLPSRRIDYALVRGWVWGNPGMPLRASVVGTRGSAALGRTAPPSDHFALVVDLWDPPVA